MKFKEIILIKFERKDKWSFVLEFDRKGCEQILLLLKSISLMEEIDIEIENNKILKIKLEENTIKMNRYSNNCIYLIMDMDEIEFLIIRLEECLFSDIEFLPAELSEIIYKHKNRDIYAKYNRNT